jgi:hypothetical protein
MNERATLKVGRADSNPPVTSGIEPKVKGSNDPTHPLTGPRSISFRQGANGIALGLFDGAFFPDGGRLFFVLRRPLKNGLNFNVIYVSELGNPLKSQKLLDTKGFIR